MTISPTVKLPKSPNSKASPTKAVQIKKPSNSNTNSNNNNINSNNTVAITTPSVTVKRKPAIGNTSSNSKKPKNNTKKPSSVPVKSASSNTVSFDSEAICPICDEACTCPKTASVNSAGSISPKKPNEILKKPAATVKNAPVKKSSASKKKTNANKDKPKFVNKNNYEVSDDSEDDDDYEDSDSYDDKSRGVVEDPALSFIRMIYSDEESLDEEEAYALYQAAQLFSSSSDEDAADYDQASSDYFSRFGSDEESDEGSDEESDDGEFEYTVVEYVQPLKKKLPPKPTEFVAYESSEEEDGDHDNAPDNNTLLLNTGNASDSDGETDECDEDNYSDDEEEDDDDSNWMTYSVFDVDRDLALVNNNNISSASASSASVSTSLSLQGSGTPDTLLFSTSSTDKIPNIAPQVLAAISAAAKHMANQRLGIENSSNSTSKYFSYITLKDPLKGEDLNEEEFLFFEEAGYDNSDSETTTSSNDTDSVTSSMSNVISDEDISIDEFEDSSSFSDCSVTEIIVKDEIIKPTTNTTNITNTNITNNNKKSSENVSILNLNRWNRVPIGAFRRSRRPSIPSFHHVHPSTALKSFSVDPVNLTLSAPFPTTTATTTNNNEDSFDEGIERAHSVITWDELDMGIISNNQTVQSGQSGNSGNSGNNGNSTYIPQPKRSRSLISNSNSLVNNFEWLNTNWNWEI